MRKSWRVVCGIFVMFLASNHFQVAIAAPDSAYKSCLVPLTDSSDFKRCDRKAKQFVGRGFVALNDMNHPTRKPHGVCVYYDFDNFKAYLRDERGMPIEIPGLTVSPPSHLAAYLSHDEKRLAVVKSEGNRGFIYLYLFQMDSDEPFYNLVK